MAKELSISFPHFKEMGYMFCRASAFPKSTISARLYDDSIVYFDVTVPASSNSPFLEKIDLNDIAGKELTLHLKSDTDLHVKNPELLLAPPGGNIVGVSYTILASTGLNCNYDEFYLFISAWRAKG